MKKGFKFFVVLCVTALATVCSMNESKADNTIIIGSTTRPGKTRGGCYGNNGHCGVTRNGTYLIGKWRE
ncbi:hypothetical protein [Alloprevotella tannerae]|uniref:hypothetical protein n=1 Tax=Alloprevotella tannerae TaxID=76122 RepID=UPI0028EB07D6|nr:hypothetical protein [Alloprevotella tannerae]